MIPDISSIADGVTILTGLIFLYEFAVRFFVLTKKIVKGFILAYKGRYDTPIDSSLFSSLTLALSPDSFTLLKVLKTDALYPYSQARRQHISLSLDSFGLPLTVSEDPL